MWHDMISYGYVTRNLQFVNTNVFQKKDQKQKLHCEDISNLETICYQNTCMNSGDQTA